MARDLGRRILVEKNDESVDERLAKLLAALHEKRVAYYAEKWPTLTPDPLTVSKGKRWIRVCAGSAYAFVESETGEIFMPQSWRSPAKHARGNVYAEDFGLSCCEVHSVVYLR